jgi:hypothetical protein
MRCHRRGKEARNSFPQQGKARVEYFSSPDTFGLSGDIDDAHTSTFQILRPHFITLSLVEREAFVRAFSPSSTLEPGLKGFHRRGH